MSVNHVAMKKFNRNGLFSKLEDSLDYLSWIGQLNTYGLESECFVSLSNSFTSKLLF